MVHMKDRPDACAVNEGRIWPQVYIIIHILFKFPVVKNSRSRKQSLSHLHQLFGKKKKKKETTTTTKQLLYSCVKTWKSNERDEWS